MINQNIKKCLIIMLSMMSGIVYQTQGVPKFGQSINVAHAGKIIVVEIDIAAEIVDTAVIDIIAEIDAVEEEIKRLPDIYRGTSCAFKASYLKKLMNETEARLDSYSSSTIKNAQITKRKNEVMSRLNELMVKYQENNEENKCADQRAINMVMELCKNETYRKALEMEDSGDWTIPISINGSNLMSFDIIYKALKQLDELTAPSGSLNTMDLNTMNLNTMNLNTMD